MTISTRDFGPVEVAQTDVVTFVEPIFGFEDHREFVFLRQPEFEPHFIWLQSVDDPDVCFVLANPSDIIADYQPQLPAAVKEALGEGEYVCWALTVLRNPYYTSTVNLKSPIVVNCAAGRAMQVILDQPYSIRQPLAQPTEQKEAP